MKNSEVIEFPLRGTWYSPTTPSKKIPSHGTTRMALTYACDFIQIDKQSKAYRASFLKYLTIGVSVEDFYCWNETVYAPMDGVVVFVENSVKERKRVHWLKESLLALKNSLMFDETKDDYKQLAGNYVILKCKEDVYAVFVHLRLDSIQVQVGDQISKGCPIARVGHSGNSTSPHLHFQLMSSNDILTAKAIPFVFENYEEFENGVWINRSKSLPKHSNIFRYHR